jgi:hypothetical protein
MLLAGHLVSSSAREARGRRHILHDKTALFRCLVELCHQLNAARTGRVLIGSLPPRRLAFSAANRSMSATWRDSYEVTPSCCSSCDIFG